MNSPLLSVAISAGYRGRPEVLRDLMLEMQPGEILGFVGESGSGKSTLTLAILRLLDLKRGQASGVIRFKGHDLMEMSEREMRSLRGKDIGLVLQSPLSSLNPALRIGTQLNEAWRAHASDMKEGRRNIMEALERVRLPNNDEFLRRYPSELSVGQAQRVLIAMAVLHKPALLITDEATSALDVVTQSEILALFSELNREMGMGILYISHDLLSVATICHRIAILYRGQVAECGSIAQIFSEPHHSYTRNLIRALPQVPRMKWPKPEMALT